MRKDYRFALKTTAIVLLGFVFCLAFVARSDAQDAIKSLTERLNQQLEEEANYDASHRSSLDYYEQKLGTLCQITKAASQLYSDVDAKLRMTQEDKEALRTFVIKTLESVKEVIGELIEFSNESGEKQPEGLLDSTLYYFCLSLDQLDAQEEYVVLEQDLRKWLKKSDVNEIKNVLEEYALLLETVRKAFEQLDGDDRIDVLFRLRNEEAVKDNANSRHIDIYNNKINLAVIRKTLGKESEAERILQHAIDRESERKYPNALMLVKWRDALEERVCKRLLDAKDVDGAVEHTRQSVGRAIKQPTIWNVKFPLDNLRNLQLLDPVRADELFVETIDRYLANGETAFVDEAARIGSYRMFVGAKIALEGICVDGTPIDWNEYLGKPGVIILYSSKDFNDKSFNDRYNLLQRYANCDGVNVIGYVADANSSSGAPLSKEQPWKTVSQKRTLAAIDKKYRDFGVYYGFLAKSPYLTTHASYPPPKTILFDEQGVVVKASDNLPFQFELEAFLHEKCPEVVEKECRRLNELFDVPEGKDAAYYYERRGKLANEAAVDISRLDDGNPIFGDRFKNLESKRLEALEKICKELTSQNKDDATADSKNVPELFARYVNLAMKNKDRDALIELINYERAQQLSNARRVAFLAERLEELNVREAEASRKADRNDEIKKLQLQIDAERAKESPNPGVVHGLTNEILQMKILNAVKQNDEQALKEALDQCVNETFDQNNNLVDDPDVYVGHCMRFLNAFDRPVAAEYLRRNALKKFESSESPQASDYAFSLAAVDRRDDLPGNEILFRGSYFNPNDPQNFEAFDWASYRGKPVLIFYYNTVDALCNKRLREISETFQRYHDAGLEVLGYFDGNGSAKEAEFIREEKIPWKTVCDCNANDASLRYVSLARYYSLPCPSAILVDADGKVIDLEAFGSRLYDDLEKLFPDVP